LAEEDVEYVNYLKTPPTAIELKKILRAAGLKPEQAMRTKEESYKKLIAGKNLSDDEMIRIMAQHPELIQRPLVVKGSKAVLARPVERLKDLGV